VRDVPRANTPEGKEKKREDQKRYYQRNKSSYIAKNKVKRAEIKDFLRKYKEFKGCGDCSGKFPFYILDFDHRDPAMKRFSPAKMAHNNSWTAMVEEIAKCDVLCANCHRERTYKDGHRFLRKKIAK
jgi:hypothetical protein